MHRLDIVAVGIEDEGTVVTGMIVRSQSGGAVVAATCEQGFAMERVDRAPACRR